MNDFLPFCNINFNGGNLSSDGGAILLLSYLERYSLFSFLKDLSFFDTRKNPEYSNYNIIKQIIYRNFLGYFNQDEQSVLFHDPLLSKYTDACSQPTVSRFFNRITNQTNMDLKENMIRMSCDYVNKHISEPILDVDSTKTETGGKQEGAAHIYHYNTDGLHPLMINEYHSKLLVGMRMRSGSSYSSNGFMAEMDEVLEYLKTDNKRVRLRGDSAFFNDKYMDYMENKEITYYLRAKGFNKIKNKVYKDIDDKGINLETYSQEHPYIGEIEYTLSKSNKERRVVYKAYSSFDKQMSLFPTVYCVITNDKESSGIDIMTFYEERGNSENFTKELKDDFDGKRVSHHEFLKNELEFLISGLCYNAFHLFQMKILEKEDKKMRMNTFRKKYQKIAVRVSKHARRVTLSFSSAYAYKKRFMYYLNKILT